MKLKFSFLFALVFACGTSFSQQFKVVKIGEQVPDFHIKIYQNGKESDAKISDFRGKVLLLDYWDIKCSSCVAGMPKMLELQKRIGDIAKIIYVTSNSIVEINAFYEKLKKLRTDNEKIATAGKQMAFITSDSILNKSFVHQGWGAQVWIDRKQNYRYLTSGEATTVNTLADFYNEDLVKLDEQKNLNLDRQNPLDWIKILPEYVQQYSFLLKRLEVRDQLVPFVITRDSTTKLVTGINVINQSILNLYRYYYKNKNKGRGIELNNIVFEVYDKNRYYNALNEQNPLNWASNNLYCYALKVPGTSEDAVYDIMLNDLDKYFGTRSFWAPRNVKYIALKKMGDGFMVKENPPNRWPDDSMRQEIKGDSVTLHAYNTLMPNLSGRISSYVRGIFGESMKFIDETKYVGKVGVSLPWYSDDNGYPSFDVMNKALGKYGLKLVEQEKIMKMLVIKEDNFTN